MAALPKLISRYDGYSVNICHNDLSEGVVNRGGSDGAHLRCLRQIHRITLARAATALQTHPTRLSQLERGLDHNHHLATRYHHRLTTHKPDLTVRMWGVPFEALRYSCWWWCRDPRFD